MGQVMGPCSYLIDPQSNLEMRGPVLALFDSFMLTVLHNALPACSATVRAVACIWLLDGFSRVKEGFHQGIDFARPVYRSCVTARVIDSLACLMQVVCVLPAFF
jgi:hypothetical protein